MHYYKFNIGDYASHTRHLSLMEDLAYRRLLDVAYTSEKPLSKDSHALARLIGMRDYQSEVEDVLREFFEEVEEGWIHGRVLKEIEEAGGRSDKAKVAAKARWECKRNADAMQSHSLGGATSIDENASSIKNDATQDPLHTTQDPRPKTQDQLPTTEKSKSLARATRLTAEWMLPKSYGEWALHEKPLWTADDVRKVADIFRDHWCAASGKGAAKLDWFATWRNWIRKEPDAPRRGSGAFLTPQQQRDQNNAKSSAEFVSGGGSTILDGIAREIL